MDRRRIARFAMGAVLALGLVSTSCDLAANSQAAGPALNAAKAGQDVSAQSELRDALVAAKTLFVQSDSYTNVIPSTLGRFEPSLCFVGSEIPAVAAGAQCEAGSGAASISVWGQGPTFAAATMSASGTCFWLRDALGSGTTYGSGQPCTGAAAVNAAGQSFSI